ncbi:MAG: alpha/beta fold hydrolase [Bauldia sp.]|nr:alpha/beta fold hydrolase [Bauldia sp.]
MIRFPATLSRLVVALVCLAAVHAAPAAAWERFGIVLLHGKTGGPGQFTQLARDLTDMGYLVEVPELCWSARRIYDRSFTGCFEDIDNAVAILENDGAEGIIVAGHSLGGVGALAYAANRTGISGVIALAPAGDPVAFGKIPVIAKSIKKARAAVAKNEDDVVETFNDFVLGKALPVRATAADFLTFFGPDSPGVMTTTLPALKAPLLWVAGTRDSSQRNAASLFAMAPKTPHNQLVKVNAGHLGTPSAAFDAILDWLDEIEPQ